MSIHDELEHELSTAYKDGYRVGYLRLGKSSCPYQYGSRLHDEWKQGKADGAEAASGKETA